MGESQEVEGLWLAASSSPLVAFDCEPAKLNQPCLVGMQCQAELFHAGGKLAEESLGIVAVLETHDEVVRVPNDDEVARCVSIPPLLNPEIENIVQVHVRK